MEIKTTTTIGNNKMKIWEEEYLKMGNLENPIIVYLEEGNRKFHIKNGKNYIGRERWKTIMKEVV